MSEINKAYARHISIRMGGTVSPTVISIDETANEIKINATHYGNPTLSDGTHNVIIVATLALNINRAGGSWDLLNPDGIKLEHLHKIASEIHALFPAVGT